MALERREILFSLGEIKDALMVIDGGMRKIPATYDMNLVEAVHTRDIHKQFHGIRDRYANIYKDTLGKDGVMFRGGNTSRLGFDQSIEFFVPEETMLKAILFACKKANIMIPRTAQKAVIAEDLFIGIRFEYMQATVGLVLEKA